MKDPFLEPFDDYIRGKNLTQTSAFLRFTLFHPDNARV